MTRPYSPYPTPSKVPEISTQERDHLFTIGYGGLIRPDIHTPIAKDFIDRGLVYESLGGYMLTDKGHHLVQNY